MEHNSPSKPALDREFEAKVSIWKSFSSTRCEDGKEAPGSLDAGLLDQPVADSTKCSLLCNEGSVSEASQADTLLREQKKENLPEHSNPLWPLNGSKSASQMAIPASDGPETHLAAKRFRSSTSNASSLFDGGVHGLERLESGPMPESSSKASLPGLTASRPCICSKIVGSIDCGPAIGSCGEMSRTIELHPSRYMNGTIPADTSSEVMLHLEGRIRVLDSQLEACHRALGARDQAIRELSSSLEVLQDEQAHDLDHGFIEQYVSRGLEVVDEMRNLAAPQDLTRENYDLRIENMNLKNTVEELVGKIKSLKAALKRT